jgi:uncharacterized protein
VPRASSLPTGPHVPLRLEPSRLGGLGVFAVAPVAAGALVESCPLLPVSQQVRDELPDRVVVVPGRGPERVAVPLGYGALYNHSAVPNLTWSVTTRVMRLVAARDVAAGEELCIDYGPDWFPERGLKPL